MLLVGPISVKLASGTKTIVVIRVDDVMEMSTIRNPGSTNDIAVDLTPEEKKKKSILLKPPRNCYASVIHSRMCLVL